MERAARHSLSQPIALEGRLVARRLGAVYDVGARLGLEAVEAEGAQRVAQGSPHLVDARDRRLKDFWRPRPAEGLALRQELDEGRVERRDHLDEENRLDDRERQRAADQEGRDGQDDSLGPCVVAPVDAPLLLLLRWLRRLGGLVLFALVAAAHELALPRSLRRRIQALDPFGRVRFRHIGLYVAGPTLALQDHVLGPLGRLELRVLLVGLKQQPCKKCQC